MKDLNDIDPLPEFKAPDWQEFLVGYGDLPESERQKKEWRNATKKADGEDWHPHSPGIERNGKGQFRTVDYKPPEPPETDIPIPCVEYAEFFGGSGEVGVVTWQAVYPRGLLTTGHMQTFCAPQYRPQAEPQTQAASQIKQKVRTKYLVRDATGRTVGVTYDPDLWIPHTPGDQAPVKDGTRVMFKRRCDGPKGTAFFGGIESQPGHWTKAEQEMYEVTAWRPA
jgi:hypothetical protein